MKASMRTASVLLYVLCLHASIAAAQTQAPPAADAQQRLVGSHGMTLYTYDPDGNSGHSQCNGTCAALWPPYLAAPGAKAEGGFGLVSRSDHSLQWSYRGRPLYRYAGDTASGTALGDGVNGNWHVVRMH